MFKIIMIILFMAAQASFAQQKVAILNTEDDGEPPIRHSELGVLTAKLRDIANKTLPKPGYDIMTEQSIVSFLGSQKEAEKVCREAEGCLAKIGRDVEADYIGQARISRFGKILTIKMEVYDSKKGTLVGSFTDESSKDIYALLAAIDKKAPAMFEKMLASSDKKAPAPAIAGGISGLEVAGGGEAIYGKRYLVSIATDPAGAALSIDGEPVAGCARTPCKAALAEGKARIIAALELHEKADTAVAIEHNNQSVVIKLRPSFGIFEARQAYIDGMGKNEPWRLTINGNAAALESKLSAGRYSAKLSHRCYEDIGFEVGIGNGGREVFEIASYAKLKTGGLVLDAERDGSPSVEPVFVNGSRVGETPFSGSVPLCAKMEVGEGRAKLNAELKHNEAVRYVAKLKGIDLTPPPAAASGQEEEKTYRYSDYMREREEIEKANSSFAFGLVLDLLGAGLIIYGVSKDSDISKNHSKYKAAKTQEGMDSAWNKVENVRSERNTLYTIGTLFLAAGVGVHIWF